MSLDRYKWLLSENEILLLFLPKYVSSNSSLDSFNPLFQFSSFEVSILLCTFLWSGLPFPFYHLFVWILNICFLCPRDVISLSCFFFLESSISSSTWTLIGSKRPEMSFSNTKETVKRKKKIVKDTINTFKERSLDTFFIFDKPTLKKRQLLIQGINEDCMETKIL